MKHLPIIGILCMLLATVAFGQTVERTHDIVAEDYFSQVFLSGVEASPDGNYTAFVDYRWDREHDRRSRDLWVVNNDTQETLRLTFDPSNETSPSWSLDSKRIYFIGHITQGSEDSAPYDGSAQVWRINVDGSELTPITRVPGGIYDYQLSDDGKFIYYTRTKEFMTDEWKDLKNTYTNVDYGHGIYEVSELWQLDLNSWRSEMLFDPKLHIHEFAVSSNGKHIATITTQDGELVSLEGWSNVTILDRSTGDSYDLYDKLWRDEAPSPHGWLGGLSWSEDGNKLAFGVDFDGYPAEIIVSDMSERAAKLMRMQRPEMVHVAGSPHWVPGEDAVAFVGDNKARARVYSVDLETGDYETLTNGDVVIGGFSFIGDKGDLVANQSTLTYYQDLVLYSRNDAERITHLNPQVDTWKLPQISILQWEGANGDMVEGILELPPDYEPGQKLPLHVTLHGGPTLAEPYCFQLWIYGRASFAAKGYAMLSPNYRGSTGYGDKFLTDLIGNENDWDVIDIMTGVDHLIAEGIVDEDQMAVSGWSNGGFLTNCLIATDRFKAASTGAGVLDMTMQLLEEDTPGHVINYMEGLPWEQPEEYQSASPLYSLKPGNKTAVLIHVGENDPRVPASHSIGLHRMLTRYLDMPCELIVYPGAGHNLTKYTHRLAKAKWDHAWIDHYTLKK
jgi:acylaminoacyl-peptidase